MAKPATRKVPIADRRGIQHFMAVGDATCGMLVRAGVEATAGALAADLGSDDWRKEVPRAELPECAPGALRFFPFQYRGHDWTSVVHRYAFQDDLAQRLSAALATRALWVGYEDVSGSIDYALYDSGAAKEVFHLGDPRSFRELSSAEMRSLERAGGVCRWVQKDPQGAYARSDVRRLDAADIRKLGAERGKQYVGHLDRLFDDFLRSQDAFLAFNALGEVGREFYPLDEAEDGEILRIDVVGK